MNTKLYCTKNCTYANMNFGTILLLVSYCNFMHLVQPMQSTKDIKKQRLYDFIIVGGGTSGTVLATRLSEITSWNILLIEAGTDNEVMNQFPAITTKYQGSNMDWHYEIQPQEGCCKGLKDRKMYWPSGKVLGGTSEINYMVYTRGNRQDYDDWSRLGNPGWSYDEVLPYFMKSEKYKFSKFNSKYHNKDGVMSIEYPYTTVVTDTFLNGANELGFDIHDYNGKSQLRFSKIKAHLEKGQRHSVFQAFLQPIHSKRKNLTVMMSARVTKIIVDPITKRAEGVVYIKNNRTKAVLTKREIILSAGVVGSTKILLLSGIGPKGDLKKLRIPVINDLPVGYGIRDHISYFGLNYLTNHQINFNQFGNYAIGMYSCNRCHKGIASSPAGVEAIGFVKLNYTGIDDAVPDVEILLVNHLINKDLKILTNVEEEVYEKCFQLAEEFVGVNIFPILLHPKSKGFIKLLSKNPFDPPIIQPNYLSEDEDVKTLVQSIKFVEKLMDTVSFANADAALYPVPVCEELEMYSQGYWECAVKTLTMSFNDYMGGCKMGSIADNESVVDPNLQVYGVHNLRVVDASVIPVTISGHTGSVAVMIAEKAADIIKKKYPDV